MIRNQSVRKQAVRKQSVRSLAALVIGAALSLHPLAAATANDGSERDGSEPDGSEPAATLRDSIVVSANRRATDADEVGSSVTVITAEEIELRRQDTVAELLRTVPGVEVVRGGGPGQVTSVFVRGGSSSQTLVLLDGVRLNTPTTGAYDLADLPADAIERIEILRGPQGTLYGSEATSGVISITTRKGRPGHHLQALAEGGELEHRRFRLGVDGTAGRYDYAVTASDLSTAGVSAASEEAGNTEDDPHDATAASLRVGTDLGDGGRADLILRHLDAEVGNDGFDFLLGPVDDLNRVQSRESTAGSLRLRGELGPRWRQSLLVGFVDDRLTGSDPDDAFSNFDVTGRNLEVQAQSDLDLDASGVLTFGLGYESRSAESIGSFDQSVDLRSVFVQHAWSWRDELHLTTGVRHDDHSQYGGETTYRVSAAWGPSERLRFHGSLGTGFKAPTLNDLFFPGFGNPELEPETSEGYDLGVETRFLGDRASFDLTWFATDFDDLIAFDFVTFLPQNVAQATSEGLEATFEVRPGPGFQLTASHTWNDTEDLATGLTLPRRPEHRSTLGVYFRPLERLRGSATLFVVRDRIDSDGRPMDDYERVDLTLHYRLSPRLEPYLRLENLFDESYQEIPGFTTPGSVAVVGLSLEY